MSESSILKLQGYDMGHVQTFNPPINLDSAKVNQIGRKVDDTYVYETQGPIGTINVSVKRVSPATPTASNPTNADFVLIMESLFESVQATKKPLKLQFSLTDATNTTFPSRTYNVFFTSFNPSYNVENPFQLSYTASFVRRKG